MEILHQEQAKVFKKQKGPKNPNADIPLFIKSGARDPLSTFSNDSIANQRKTTSGTITASQY